MCNLFQRVQSCKKKYPRALYALLICCINNERINCTSINKNNKNNNNTSMFTYVTTVLRGHSVLREIVFRRARAHEHVHRSVPSHIQTMYCELHELTFRLRSCVRVTTFSFKYAMGVVTGAGSAVGMETGKTVAHIVWRQLKQCRKLMSW